MASLESEAYCFYCRRITGTFESDCEICGLSKQTPNTLQKKKPGFPGSRGPKNPRQMNKNAPLFDDTPEVGGMSVNISVSGVRLVYRD